MAWCVLTGEKQCPPTLAQANTTDQRVGLLPVPNCSLCAAHPFASTVTACSLVLLPPSPTPSPSKTFAVIAWPMGNLQESYPGQSQGLHGLLYIHSKPKPSITATSGFCNWPGANNTCFQCSKVSCNACLSPYHYRTPAAKRVSCAGSHPTTRWTISTPSSPVLCIAKTQPCTFWLQGLHQWSFWFCSKEVLMHWSQKQTLALDHASGGDCGSTVPTWEFT